MCFKKKKKKGRKFQNGARFSPHRSILPRSERIIWKPLSPQRPIPDWQGRKNTARSPPIIAGSEPNRDGSNGSSKKWQQIKVIWNSRGHQEKQKISLGCGWPQGWRVGGGGGMGCETSLPFIYLFVKGLGEKCFI